MYALSALTLTGSGPDNPGMGTLPVRPAHDWILSLSERRCAQLEDTPKSPGGPATAAAPGPPDDGATPTPTKIVIPYLTTPSTRRRPRIWPWSTSRSIPRGTPLAGLTD
jgi:hypothetical protein